MHAVAGNPTAKTCPSERSKDQALVLLSNMLSTLGPKEKLSTGTGISTAWSSDVLPAVMSGTCQAILGFPYIGGPERDFSIP